ncbi:MAG: EAL domain-containing protein [Roseiflexaceae bacterium]
MHSQQPPNVAATSDIAARLPSHAWSLSADSSTLLLDNSGVIIEVSLAAAGLLGRDSKELIGSPLGFPVGVKRNEIEVIWPDGTLRIAEVSADTIERQGGAVQLVHLIDVTEQRRNEQLLLHSQRFLKATLDALVEHIAILDANGTIVAVNAAWEQFITIHPVWHELDGPGQNYLRFCDRHAGNHNSDFGLIANGLRAVMSGSVQRFVEEYRCSLNERLCWIEISATRFGVGPDLRVVVSHRDITERRRNEQFDHDRGHILSMVARNGDFAGILSQIELAMARLFPENRISIILTNDVVSTYAPHRERSLMLKQACVELFVNFLYDHVDTMANEWLLEVDDTTLFDDSSAVELCHALQGNLRHYWVVTLPGDQGFPRSIWLGFAHVRHCTAEDRRLLDQIRQILDIACDQYQRSRQLDYQVHHDALTGLPNRLLFEERLNEAIERAQRHVRHIAVLFIDLDRFKQINDTLGHPSGDELLKLVGQRLLRGLRSVDTLARRGGDEFMVVLPDIENPAMAGKAAQRLMELLRQPFQLEGQDLFISASIGVSIYPEDGTDSATLQRNADTAMYRIKSSVRDGVQFFQAPMNTAVREQLTIETQLRRAIERNELQIVYQPQVDRGLRMVSAEALLRWHNPQLGAVSPGHFIPIAEESGLIVPIGAWCLQQVCRQIRAWEDAGLTVSHIAVNVSALQFRSSTFIDFVEQTLIETQIRPEQLELELTESVLMGDFDQVEAQLLRLRALGVQLAIDDFGTGYSSLGYLSRMPIDTLKIDRSFVMNLRSHTSDTNLAIIQAIITMAHALKKQVVAEGVEQYDQLSLLQAAQCDRYQGYLFARPCHADELANLLHTNTPYQRRYVG